MRYAIVTETYPPEVNGVALTVQGLETGLRARGHAVQVIRPRASLPTPPMPTTTACWCVGPRCRATRACASACRPPND